VSWTFDITMIVSFGKLGFEYRVELMPIKLKIIRTIKRIIPIIFFFITA
jgi:hypothetical protein